MKKLALIALLGVTLLSGCASTQPGGNTPQATTPPPVVQKPLPIPSASAKKLVLVMSGSKASTEAKDWGNFKEEWRAAFAEHAKDAGVAFAMQEGEGRATGDAGTLVSVYVNDYRMVGIGARIWLGVMSGNAYIDAKANYSDLKAGKAFGSRDYNTTSSAWHGVFGKMTPQQVDAIATQVFSELKNTP
jgi:hypothetical protein